jgi:hypothetical protein
MFTYLCPECRNTLTREVKTRTSYCQATGKVVKLIPIEDGETNNGAADSESDSVGPRKRPSKT